MPGSILTGLCVCTLLGFPLEAAQQEASPPALRAVTRTLYTPSTELFLEFRPLIVGEETRLTAHLTRVGERFRPYAEGSVKLTLTVDAVTAEAAAAAPERAGVFRLNVAAKKAGTGRIVLDLMATTGVQHFVINDVPVFVDAQAAQSTQLPEEMGLIAYAKERSWEQDFATAAVTVAFGGVARIITVPLTAVMRDGDTACVFVQRTFERFEWREVKTRRTIGNAIEITSGLREGERIVVRGTEQMPRQ